MDPQALVQLFVQGGFAAVVLYIWWKDRQQVEALIEEIRKREAVLEEIGRGLMDLGQGIKKLVDLQYQVLGGITEVQTRMADNFFCPIVRTLGRMGGGFRNEAGDTDSQGPAD